MTLIFRHLILAAGAIAVAGSAIPSVEAQSRRNNPTYRAGRNIMGAIGQRVVPVPGMGRATREVYDVGGRFQDRYEQRLRNFGRDHVRPRLRQRSQK